MSNPNRIVSVDILRGLVMIIMALDHTRDFFHITAMTADPLNPLTTTAALFFTRWITHFCAPVFLLLSGLSAYLSSRKKTPGEAAAFLIKRGVWLILAEVLIVTPGLTFNPFYNVIILQVIWATGCSMIVLGLLVRLPVTVIFATGLVIFFGHNILDYISLPQSGVDGAMWRIFLTAKGYIIPVGKDHFIADFYTVLPWTGIMLCGYYLGTWFSADVEQTKRRQLLLLTGGALVLLFILLRIINLYGNPEPRSVYNNLAENIFSFLNTSKYPPSLQYCCMTLGPALILLSFLEKTNNQLSRTITVYGKVPFFYYVIHFYLLHLLLVCIFFATGHGVNEIVDKRLPFLFRPMTFGFSLPVIYLIWISVVVILYKPCRWYTHYKATHKKWWLAYL